MSFVPRQPRVLVVEDDAVIRKLLATALGRVGIAVDGAEDGFEALARLRESGFAVIIIDLMMPRMYGYELLGFLSAQFPRPQAVVLVMTANDDSAFRSLDAEIVHGYFRKPFDLTSLVEMISDCALTMTDKRHASGAWRDSAEGEREARPSV